MSNYPLIISFYTENTLYENEVEGLRISSEELDLETDIEKVPNLGCWQKNCFFKPSFILKKLLEHKRPLLWVDCDTIVLKKPDFYLDHDCDISLKRYDEYSDLDPNKFFTGTMFLNFTERTINFIKKWVDKSSLVTDTRVAPDQETFNEVFLEDKEIKFLNMPLSYSFIFDISRPRMDPEEIVILHFQASRLRDGKLYNSALFFRSIDNLALKTMRQNLNNEQFYYSIKDQDLSFESSIEKYKFLLDFYNKKLLA